MSIFSSNKKKIGDTEFVKDPVAFIRFLREEDEDVVEFGKTSLVVGGTVVIKPLIELLTNELEDEKVRRRAGNVLTRIGTPAIAPLLEVLETLKLNSQAASATIGMIAAALGGMGKEAVAPLIRALDSELRQVRFGAAIALAQTGEAKAIEAVRHAADHGAPGDRDMYTMVLGSAGPG